MSEKIEQIKRSTKVGWLTAQTLVERMKMYTRAREVPLIVMLGDSRAKAWPAPSIPSQYLLFNRGVGFDTSDQVLQRLSAHVIPLRPHVVLLQAGVNDLKRLLLAPQNRAIIIEETLTSLIKIVKQVRTAGAHVILSTVFPVSNVDLQHANLFWGFSVADSAQVIRSALHEINSELLARRAAGVTHFDAATLLQSADGWLEPTYARDALHLNQAGYAMLNQSLGPVLQELIE